MHNMRDFRAALYIPSRRRESKKQEKGGMQENIDKVERSARSFEFRYFMPSDWLCCYRGQCFGLLVAGDPLKMKIGLTGLNFFRNKIQNSISK